MTNGETSFDKRFNNVTSFLAMHLWALPSKFWASCSFSGGWYSSGFDVLFREIYTTDERALIGWQCPLSGVHSIMMVNSAQPGEYGGCTPFPFQSIYHHVQSCGGRSSLEGRLYTPPIAPLWLILLSLQLQFGVVVTAAVIAALLSLWLLWCRWLLAAVMYLATDVDLSKTIAAIEQLTLSSCYQTASSSAAAMEEIVVFLTKSALPYRVSWNIWGHQEHESQLS
jgi:hypothetical protein